MSKIVLGQISAPTRRIHFTPPVVEGLQYWSFFGGDASQSLKNWGGADGALQGDPDYHTGWTRFGPGERINMVFTDTAEFSLMAVGKTPDDGSAAALRPQFMTNHNGSSVSDPGRNGGGVGLYGSAATTLSGRAGTWNGTSNQTGELTLPGVNLAVWGYMEFVMGAGNRHLCHRTQSLRVDGTYSSERDPISVPFRIGGGFSVPGGNTDLAFAAIYARRLTDDELDAVYACVQTNLLQPGFGEIVI